jgi:hypothetical protein
MQETTVARFDFDGPESAFFDTYQFIFQRWLPKSGFRYGFAPTVTLIATDAWGTVRERSRARLLVPIQPLAAASK